MTFTDFINENNGRTIEDIEKEIEKLRKRSHFLRKRIRAGKSNYKGELNHLCFSIDALIEELKKLKELEN